MAKGIDINATLKGKRGGVVYYRRLGEQVSRVKVTPANPKTAKQAVQRMVLATAAKMASAYEPIINHSFEGTPVGTQSVQEFRSYAMHALRSAAAYVLNDVGEDIPVAEFAIKGAPIVGALNNLQISRGSLGMNGYVVEDGDMKIVLASALSQSITTQAGYEAELRKLGCAPGDQLTFVCLEQSSQVVASFTKDDYTVNNYAQLVRFARVVFKAELPDDFSGGLLDGTAINAALIQETLGTLPAFSEGTTSGGGIALVAAFDNVLDTGYQVEALGLIRSQKQLNGKFKYSTGYMDDANPDSGYNNARSVYQSYMNNVGEINVGDELYLRHAVASPFEVGE